MLRLAWGEELGIYKDEMDKFRERHTGDERLFLDQEGFKYCAYSTQRPLPSCKYSIFQGSKAELCELSDGTRCYLRSCFNARFRFYPEKEAILVTKIKNGST